jgi:SSS family solute:Na+ symporter
MNLLVILAYVAVMLGISIVSLRKVKSLSGFFVADRGAGVFLVTASLLSTIIGGSATLGMAGLGFSQGLTGAWWMLSGVLGLLVLAAWLAGRIRNLEVFTLPAILERQYGSQTLRVAASLLIAVAWIGIVAGQMIAAGKILAVLWPDQTETLIVSSGLAFTAYIALAGQHSVLKTDLVQLVVILLGVALCAVYVPTAGGDWGTIKAGLPAGHLDFPVSEAFSWGALATYLLFVGLPYLVGPDLYGRVLSARDGGTARRALVIAAIVLIPFAFAVTAIGLYARVLLPGTAPESAFPALVLHALPAGLAGLVIAALFAAVIPSTSLMTVGSILTWDVLVPVLRLKPDDGRLLNLSRVVIVLLGVLSIAIALMVSGIISSLMMTYTVFTSGVVVPLLFGFYAKPLRLNATGAILAVLGGGALGLALKLAGFKDLVLISLPVSVLLLFAGSYGARLFRKQSS